MKLEDIKMTFRKNTSQKIISQMRADSQNMSARSFINQWVAFADRVEDEKSGKVFKDRYGGANADFRTLMRPIR